MFLGGSKVSVPHSASTFSTCMKLEWRYAMDSRRGRVIGPVAAEIAAEAGSFMMPLSWCTVMCQNQRRSSWSLSLEEFGCSFWQDYRTCSLYYLSPVFDWQIGRRLRRSADAGPVNSSQNLAQARTFSFYVQESLMSTGTPSHPYVATSQELQTGLETWARIWTPRRPGSSPCLQPRNDNRRLPKITFKVPEHFALSH